MCPGLDNYMIILSIGQLLESKWKKRKDYRDCKELGAEGLNKDFFQDPVLKEIDN